jgi:hypothetical protein
VDEDLLGGFGLRVFVGSFDELAVEESGPGPDERDQVRGLTRVPWPNRRRNGVVGSLIASAGGVSPAALYMGSAYLLGIVMLPFQHETKGEPLHD